LLGRRGNVECSMLNVQCSVLNVRLNDAFFRIQH
jgi:hypothetical protein